MIFTIPHLINSIAGALKERYPDYPVYDSPNQQGTDFPCFFNFLMPSQILDEVGGRFRRDIGIDIIFVQQRNITNGNAQIQEVQEYLDCSLDMIPYTDGTGMTLKLHTYDREAKTEDDELHYQFYVRQHVSAPRHPNPMAVMEENNVNVKEKRKGGEEVSNRQAFGEQGSRRISD